MVNYYGTVLSKNILRREPEGYIICRNVPVARTGVQEYLPEELGLPGFEMIPVLRPAEEVFAPEAMASFEGMPVTNDHPTEGVDIDNIRWLQMGHAQNVRRGTGAESDLLLADLVITDERLIDAILKEKKRAVSCGYNYELCEENGQFVQRKIRGDHISIVHSGRAGSRVSIKDNKNERRKQTMKNSIAKMLVKKAKDGDFEAVEKIGEMLEEAAEAVTENTTAEESITVEVPENREITIDEETFAGLITEVKKIGEMLAQLLGPAPAEDEDPEAEEYAEMVEEAIEAASGEEDPEGIEEIEEMVENILDPDDSTTLEESLDEDEECEEAENERKEMLADCMMAIRPALKDMSAKKRKKAVKDIAARYYGKGKKKKASSLDALSGKRRNSDRNSADLGKRIMAARNANYRG